MHLVSTIGALLLGSTSILLTWLVVGAAFIGLGLGVRQLLGLHAVDLRRIMMAFWTGFVLVILFLQLWNFVLPVGWPALVVVLMTGAAGWLSSRRNVAGWFRLVPWRRELPKLVFALLLMLWVANHASGRATQYDSGLYHTQAVRWFASYPLVPGLAHLHGRLAFNNASLLYAAMLDTGPWAGRASHLANGLPLVAFLAQILVSLFTFRRAEPEDRPVHLFTLLLLAPVIVSAIHEDVRSYTTDLSLAFILFAATVQLYTSLTRPDPNPREESFNLGWVVALCALAVCVKLSAAVFAVVACVLVATLWFRRTRAPGQWSRRDLALALIVPVALSLSWLGRGVVMSGYPTYPAPVVAASVEWKVPHDQAVAEQEWIAHAARYSQTGGGIGWDWFDYWLRNRTTSNYAQVRVMLPFFLSLAALLALLVQRFRRRAESARPSGWLILLPLLAGLVFWFVTAPSVRFVFPVLWLIAATCVVQTWRTYFGHREAGWPRWAFIAVLALGVLPLGMPVFRVMVEPGGMSGSRMMTALRYSWLLGPGPDRGLYPMTIPKLRQEVTASGLTVNVPDGTSLCWDAPLPCTPHPAPNLRLRRPGDLGSGFMIDGPWMPVRWPNAYFDFLGFRRCMELAAGREIEGRSCVARFTSANSSGAGEAGSEE